MKPLKGAMTHNDEIWVPISDKQQMWWRVVCTYDGKPGCVCAAVGSTANEAKANLLDSLADPYLALIEETSPIGFCEVPDAINDLFGLRGSK
jgi:hypothetical protein